MLGLKEIRTRILSVQGTRQITGAMKMVSAAKLRKAQDSIIQIRPYANKLKGILIDLFNNLKKNEIPVYLKKREVKKVLIIAVSSNKGLCGAFNANIAKKVVHLLENNYKKLYTQNNVDIFSIGKKATDLIKSKGFKITETHHDLLEHLNYNLVSPFAQRIIQSFDEGLYDEIVIVYNQFRNAAIQDLIVEQYLPLLTPEPDTDDFFYIDYILEPSKGEIIHELIPKLLNIQLYKALLDSIASEHGARMTAMHKASDNANEMIRSLHMEYNKARQASITKEILEIVGGAEALNK